MAFMGCVLCLVISVLLSRKGSKNKDPVLTEDGPVHTVEGPPLLYYSEGSSWDGTKEGNMPSLLLAYKGWQRTQDPLRARLLFSRGHYRLLEAEKRAVCSGRIMHNHIPEDEHVSYKDLFAANMREYGALKPGLHKMVKVPATYNLKVHQECEDLCQRLDSNATLLSLPWFDKGARDMHNSDAVQVLPGSDLFEKLCLKAPDGAVSCNSEHNVRVGKCNCTGEAIVQEAMLSPLLIDGKKFHIRHFLYVLSAEPLVIVGWPGADYVRFGSIMLNDTSASLNQRHITNSKLHGAVPRMNLEGLGQALQQEQIARGYEMFGGKEGPEWVQQDLLPKLYAAGAAVIKAAGPHMGMDCMGSFMYVGYDFLLDEDLQLWFIESSPYSWTKHEYLLYVLDFEEARRQLIAQQGIRRWQAEYGKWDIKTLLSRRRPVDIVVDERKGH